MTNPDTNALLDLLDRWRHLPSYSLEPRVDPFFALFLPEALNHHLRSRGIEIDPRLIPEFPIKQSETRRSDKADFFALSLGRKDAFLIELKTEGRSLRETQEKYLLKAVDRGLPKLLCDVRTLAKTPKRFARKKYFHLLKSMEEIGLIELPPGLEEKVYGRSSHGIYDMIDAIRICRTSARIQLIHVLPHIHDLSKLTEPIRSKIREQDCIDFQSFANSVRHLGIIGLRFADSLEGWAETKAGEIEQ